MRVAFVGLGAMGWPMAANLARAAAGSGVATPMAEASLALYRRAQAAGLGGKDAAALVTLLNS